MLRLSPDDGLIQIAPESRALQIPMMFASYEELDYVMDRITRSSRQPSIEGIQSASLG